MKTDTKINWLQNIIDEKKRIKHEWQFVAQTRNICDNMGRNPITILNKEIKIAQELIDMCNRV